MGASLFSTRVVEAERCAKWRVLMGLSPMKVVMGRSRMDRSPHSDTSWCVNLATSSCVLWNSSPSVMVVDSCSQSSW